MAGRSRRTCATCAERRPMPATLANMDGWMMRAESGRDPIPAVGSGLRGRFHATAHLLAGTLGDILPIHRVVVGFGGAGACMLGRAAIILARLADAIALVLGCIWCNGSCASRSCKAKRHDAGDRCLKRGRYFHVVSS